MNIIILILVCIAGVMLIAWAVTRSGRDNPMRGLGMEEQGRSEVNMQAVNRDEMLRLLTTKQKIAAIKRYREMTGAGLREAKEAVEQMERELVMGSLPVVEIRSPLLPAGISRLKQQGRTRMGRPCSLRTCGGRYCAIAEDVITGRCWIRRTR